LYAAGRTTGISCDIGEGVTCAAPIVEGFPLNHAVRKTFFAGKGITDRLVSYLGEDNERFGSLGKHHQSQIGQKLKHKYCFVSLDVEEDEEEAGTSGKFQAQYKLPSGQKLEMNEARFLAPEAIFDPSLASYDHDETEGLHHITFASIQAAEIDNRRDLYQSVVLSGGTSLCKGLPERLEQELDAMAPQPNMVKILAPPDRQYSVWLGGSILSNVKNFQWISKDDYEEEGAEVVHSKLLI